MPFRFERLAIPEVLLIEPRTVRDNRGHFMEMYKRSAFAAAGVTDMFVQENQSSSERHVLRGLHYQRPPHAQSKLVRVITGQVFDVVVDLRPDSPTSGRWVGLNLSADDRSLLYIPSWCAHGFCVLSDRAEVVYHASAEYSPECEAGVMWNDPALGIDWPIKNPIVSERDRNCRHSCCARDVGPCVWRQLMSNSRNGRPASSAAISCGMRAGSSDWRITTLDKLTYAGRMETLKDVIDNPRHRFVRGDVADAEVAGPLVKARGRRALRGRNTCRSVDLSWRVHQDRRIGTFVLLEAARASSGLRRFIQISTDEVYGSVAEGSSVETDELRPRNPYSASKTGADRLASSYWATYGVPVIITRASNNYGPYQFPEKVIPLFITNAFDNISVPLYGAGLNIRDWMHVMDHCRGVDVVIERGDTGEVYNIGGGNEVRNVDLTHMLLRLAERPESLIKKVQDRQGHDLRYSLDTTKLRGLGWTPRCPSKRV